MRNYWVATLSIGESSFLGRFPDRESAEVWMREELTKHLEASIELPQVYGEINRTTYTLNVFPEDSKENHPCVKSMHPFCKENCDERDEACGDSSPWCFECDELVSCTLVEAQKEETPTPDYAFVEENMEAYTPCEVYTPLSKDLRVFLESLTDTLVKFSAQVDMQKSVLGLPFAKDDFLNSPDLSKLLESLGTQDSLRAEIISLLANI